MGSETNLRDLIFFKECSKLRCKPSEGENSFFFCITRVCTLWYPSIVGLLTNPQTEKDNTNMFLVGCKQAHMLEP